MMVCLIFHTAIIINRKNWRISIKLNFKNISIFFLKWTYTNDSPPPPPPHPVHFCSLLNDPLLPSPQWTYFLNDPYVFLCNVLQLIFCSFFTKLSTFIFYVTGIISKIFLEFFIILSLKSCNKLQGNRDTRFLVIIN